MSETNSILTSLYSEECPTCGECLSTEGYGMPARCPNASEERWWYQAPDSGPYYCLEGET